MTSTSNPALFQAATSYQPADFRALVRMVYPSAGVIGAAAGTDLKAVETSPTSLAVRVATGRAVVQDTRLTSPLDLYLAGTTSAYTTISLSAADPSNPRIDRIVLKVTNTESGDGSSTTTIVAVTGTPGAVPVAPAAPSGSLSLATVRVGTGVTVIGNADITDVRVFAASDLNVSGGTTVIVPGYNGYAWTQNASDQYVLTGSTASVAGRTGRYAASPGTGNTVGRIGLMRRGLDQSAVGSIILGGDIAFSTVAGSSVATLGLGLCTALASSWSEGVGLVADASVGSVKFYTNTSAGVDLTAYSAGTQRGSTVTGLAANTWYPYKITISAAGNVKVEFNGSTVFDGAGGVDLISTSAVTPGVGLAALTAANEVYVGPSYVSYST